MIDSPSDWAEWSFPRGAARVDNDGWVRLVAVNKRINACLDAGTYSYDREGLSLKGGIGGVGSNASSAGRVMDGDAGSYWAPAADAPLKDWWIVVDVGRAVAATQIRLIFPESRTPFSEFVVYASDGTPKFPGTSSKAIDYRLITRTRRPNTDHVFEYSFDSERDELGRSLSGRVLQYVKIVFTASVEDPGLGEVEVIALNNIALGTVQRGGSIATGDGRQPASNLIDGKMWSGWVMLLENWLGGNTGGPWFRLDLGAQFWVDTVRLTANGFAGQPTDLEGFKLYVSDGQPAVTIEPSSWQVDGKDIVWDQVANVKNNSIPPVLDHEIVFAPRPVRYIFFHHFYGTGYYRSRGSQGAKLFECLISGEGVVPGVTLKSKAMDLGQTKNITSVGWNGIFPEGTSVDLRTRTGNEVEEVKHYFSKDGREVTLDAYNRTPKSMRGPVTSEIVPVDSTWSDWSPSYSFSGERFLSPNPRRYLQMVAGLLSRDRELAPSLDSIVLSYTTPLAERLYGEIRPRLCPPARTAQFSFFVRPATAPTSRGFDVVRIKTPSEAGAVTVLVGGKESKVTWSAMRDSLVVRLPRLVRTEEVEVQFSATPVVNSTLFSAAVADSRDPGLWQLVDPDAAHKNATTVLLAPLAAIDRLVGDVAIEPSILTPNGDGANDGIEISFTVLKVQEARSIDVSVYDMRGRLVRRLFSQPGISGPYRSILWDGRNDHQEIVSPGMYTCRIAVEGDQGGDKVNHVVAVVY